MKKFIEVNLENGECKLIDPSTIKYIESTRNGKMCVITFFETEPVLVVKDYSKIKKLLKSCIDFNIIDDDTMSEQKNIYVSTVTSALPNIAKNLPNLDNCTLICEDADSPESAH